jgi:hypothetical protein
VAKNETKPGEGGEQDAAGLYVHVMLQAYSLTHRKEFLDEAETSALKLQGLSFGVLYQTNNTAMAAVALARLWRITEKAVYKELSLTCVGSILSHLWLWHLGPGTRTYMALPPLHDAPYVAFYEEAEVMASLVEWQRVFRDAVPRGMSLILAEYHKHLLSRGKFYYPAELPRDLLAEDPKEGPIQRGLAVPLEGLGMPDEKAGTVGQAVYGAAAPFVLATRNWHRPEGAPFEVFCNYPVLEMESGGDSTRGYVKVRIGGSGELSCLLRVIPRGRRPASLQIRLVDGTLRRPPGVAVGWQAAPKGGSQVEIRWETCRSRGVRPKFAGNVKA